MKEKKEFCKASENKYTHESWKYKKTTKNHSLLLLLFGELRATSKLRWLFENIATTTHTHSQKNIKKYRK